MVHAVKSAEKVDMWCGEIRTASAHFPGFKLLRLREGCRAVGRQVMLRTRRHNIKGHAHIRATALDLHLEELSRWTGGKADNSQDFL